MYIAEYYNNGLREQFNVLGMRETLPKYENNNWVSKKEPKIIRNAGIELLIYDGSINTTMRNPRIRHHYIEASYEDMQNYINDELARENNYARVVRLHGPKFDALTAK